MVLATGVLTGRVPELLEEGALSPDERVRPEASHEGGEKTRYVGIDVGKVRCRAAIMGEGGFILDELTFANSPQGIGDLASKLSTEDRVVMESTGSVWTNLYNSLEDKRIPVVLANPLKTKAIAWARIKSDKVDARVLAHLQRGDLMAESYVPPRELREVRALVRHRASIVKVRTMVKNRVYALIDRYGFKPSCPDLFGKSGVEWLKRLELDPLDRLMLHNHLRHIECLNEQVRRVDEEIRSRASEDEDIRLLLSITGVDIYTALLIRSEVGCVDRFSDYRSWSHGLGSRPACTSREAWSTTTA